MVRGHAVAAQQREIFDIGGGFGLVAVDQIVKADVALQVPRNAKAQGERLARGGAAVALFRRHGAGGGMLSVFAGCPGA